MNMLNWTLNDFQNSKLHLELIKKGENTLIYLYKTGLCKHIFNDGVYRVSQKKVDTFEVCQINTVKHFQEIFICMGG